MDWQSLNVSLQLAVWTTVILFPVSVYLSRALAWRQFAGKSVIEALVALPLVLPPTVLGFYLLIMLGGDSVVGQFYEQIIGQPLVFSFEGILIASLIFNLPFAVQPLQRSFESISGDLREASWCSGLSAWQTFWRIELPLAWPGALSSIVLTFAHTLGEFGVVLMVGGNIPGETKTLAINIYERVQAFDDSTAATMSAFLLIFSFIAIVVVQGLGSRAGKWR